MGELHLYRPDKKSTYSIKCTTKRDRMGLLINHLKITSTQTEDTPTKEMWFIGRNFKPCIGRGLTFF